ncbi:Uncharacterised protein [Achromobacter xylosoxidans]|uniref:hypothetical protein n=1 Tax=Achromobacter TaxID=222 RepID=UPI0006BF3BE1|nr:MULTISPECIES: hypothetical protein [Achromobacter]CAB3730363.1 hypothetical protein LMG1866_04582 [Achromobacter ruhlandii]CAB3919540.1 hypothetical protein LMG26846_05495 [Achromobacter insuavis]CUJ32946.1 Uncharacterised protein [Achromobacter xylosoxidans]CUJ40205.1 Uncharacterised protein [Achromobacter sp. 2789STDY5608621]
MQDLICHANDFTNLHQALAGGALIAVIVTVCFLKNLARMRARIHRWRSAPAAVRV